MRSILTLLALLALLASCKTKQHRAVEVSRSIDSLVIARMGDSVSLRITTDDSVYILREHFDTIGRLTSREVIRRGVSTRQESVATTELKQTTHKHERQEERRVHKSQSQPSSILSPQWWLLIIAGIVVGIFVSVKYFRPRL